MTNPFPPGADGRRPLTSEALDRLASELGDAGLIGALRAADRARPVSADLHARLEASLVGPARPLPQRLERRLQRLLGPAPHRALGIAAAVIVAFGLASLALVGAGGSDRRATGDVTIGEPVSPGASGPGTPRDPAGAGDGLIGPLVPSDSGRPDGGDILLDASPGSGATAGPTGGQATADGRIGPPPPFAFHDDTEPATAVAPAGPTTTTAPAADRPPLRVGLAGAGAGTGVEAGVRAYVGLLNAEGGVAGRRVELVDVSAERTVPRAVAVVNVGDALIAGPDGPPGWAPGPLLEVPEAPENLLAGRVFSFSSVLERQAHLAVLAAFPDPAPGARAVVYTGGREPWATRVPAAFEQALRSRQVVPVRAAFGSASPLRPDGDAVFLSLATGDARSYLAASPGDGGPPRGTWGVASLFDEALLDVAGGVRLASPFAPDVAAEMAALRDRSGRPVSAATVHGWITAKAIAVAAWQADASTPDEMLAALDALPGWHTGFLPPYEVRPGTRSRTPEALVVEVRDGAFVPAGDFRRDPL